jgi:hypothetical protein
VCTNCLSSHSLSTDDSQIVTPRNDKADKKIGTATDSPFDTRSTPEGCERVYQSSKCIFNSSSFEQEEI